MDIITLTWINTVVILIVLVAQTALVTVGLRDVAREVRRVAEIADRTQRLILQRMTPQEPHA